MCIPVLLEFQLYFLPGIFSSSVSSTVARYVLYRGKFCGLVSFVFETIFWIYIYLACCSLVHYVVGVLCSLVFFDNAAGGNSEDDGGQ